MGLRFKPWGAGPSKGGGSYGGAKAKKGGSPPAGSKPLSKVANAHRGSQKGRVR